MESPERASQWCEDCKLHACASCMDLVHMDEGTTHKIILFNTEPSTVIDAEKEVLDRATSEKNPCLDEAKKDDSGEVTVSCHH
jgi:hypothetical protein